MSEEIRVDFKDVKSISVQMIEDSDCNLSMLTAPEASVVSSTRLTTTTTSKISSIKATADSPVAAILDGEEELARITSSPKSTSTPPTNISEVASSQVISAVPESSSHSQQQLVQASEERKRRKAEVEENIRNAKRRYELENAIERADAQRRKEFLADLNACVPSSIFQHLTATGLKETRDAYLEECRKKIGSTVFNVKNRKIGKSTKDLSKTEINICKRLNAKILWRYCYSFASILLSHNKIYHAGGLEAPSVESFGDLYQYLVATDDNSEILQWIQNTSLDGAFARVVESDPYLKGKLKPVLLQICLFLRTFLHLIDKSSESSESPGFNDNTDDKDEGELQHEQEEDGSAGFNDDADDKNEGELRPEQQEDGMELDK